MDNVPLDTEYQYYWQADSSQAQNFPYYPNPSVSYPPSALPPQPSYNAPPPDYNSFNCSVPSPSYFSVPPPNSSTVYPPGSVTYSSYEYHSHTSVQENKDYYTTSYAQAQSSTYNYNNWDPKCPYQQDSKTDNTQWVAETSSWLSHTAVNSKSQNSSTDKGYKSVSNGLRRSKSPDGKSHSSKFTSRRKYDDYSNRYGDRNKERRSSRDRFYKRRSRSLDRKSYASNNSYTNHSSARKDRSERSERSESKSRSRRSISRSRSKRRSRSQESYTSLQSSRSTNHVAKRKSLSEREMLLEKYRQNYCATSEDIKRKLNELESDGVLERKIWTRTAPADLYYSRDEKNNKLMRATGRLIQLCDDFKKILIDRASSARELQVSI